MKLNVKPDKLKFLILGAGGLGLVLRIWLYATGLDDKGLLESGHLAHVLVWVLTVSVLAVLAWQTRSYKGAEEYDAVLPVSWGNAIGSVLLAVAVLISAVKGMQNSFEGLNMVYVLLGFGTAVSLIVTGGCRLTGARPHFLFHVTVCVYFVVSLVRCYQNWSSDPQLQDYCFQLLAGVCLALAAYHRGTFEVDMGKHSAFWLYSLSAVFFCCLSVAGSGDGFYYFAAGVWAFTGLTELKEKHRRTQSTLNMQEE